MLLLQIHFILFVCVSMSMMIYKTAADTSTCNPTDFTCKNGRCINIAWKCDGDDDCGDRSDELECPSTTCSEGFFQCDEGKCIPNRWVCDGVSECNDDSDENLELCNNRTCSSYECNDSHQCIPKEWKCDGSPDCPNGDDEKDCGKLCDPKSEFMCNDSKCIDIKWKCDGSDDCGDGSDERDCSNIECESEKKMCNNGECLNEKWWCDGYPDCNDESDEANCTSTKPATCGPSDFQCHFLVADIKCINIEWKCDGVEDCSDGSDEFNCTEHHTCNADEKMCNNGHCIKATYFCDNDEDCDDGSDEKNCSHTSVTLTTDCKTGEFDCGNNKCIPDRLICNGADDCGNFADETPDRHCPEMTNNTCAKINGGCNQICIPDKSEESGRKCECFVGFDFKENSDTECDDIDECKIPGTCSQECKNTKGSYKCQCTDGYILVNHRYCKAEHGAHAELIMSDRYDIRRYHLDTYHFSVLLPEGVPGAVAIDFDIRNKSVFWTDEETGKVHSTNLETNKTKVIVDDNRGKPDCLAVDWIHGNLYICDTGLDKIEVARTDGTHRKTLISEDLDEPRALVLDPSSGWMYWIELGDKPRIEKCGMNGQNRKAIVTRDISWPFGLTIDYVQKRLYWVDAKLHSIGSSDLNGNNFRLIYKNHRNLGHPFAITMFEDYLYWTDWFSNAVHRFSKFGRDNVSTIALDLKRPMDIHVYHISRQPDSANSCGNNNGGCSHLCLPLPQMTNSATVSRKSECACPDNMVLNDRFNCIPSTVSDTKHLQQTTDSTQPDGSHTSKSNSLSTQIVTTASSKMEAISKSEEATTSKSEEATVSKSEETTVSKSEEAMVKSDSEKSQIEHKIDSAGHIAAIAIVSLLSFGIAVFVVAYLLVRRHKTRNVKSMNFDNPVYRKTTTEEQLIMEKNGSRSNLPQSMQPLNQDNDIV